jgi:hypothetical protein
VGEPALLVRAQRVARRGERGERAAKAPLQLLLGRGAAGGIALGVGVGQRLLARRLLGLGPAARGVLRPRSPRARRLRRRARAAAGDAHARARAAARRRGPGEVLEQRRKAARRAGVRHGRRRRAPRRRASAPRRPGGAGRVAPAAGRGPGVRRADTRRRRVVQRAAQTRTSSPPPAQHDLARLLELAHLRDDRRLRRLDVAHLDRPHELHLLLERGDRALRHGAHDLRLELVARRLERERELLGLDLAQQPLQRLVVERDRSSKTNMRFLICSQSVASRSETPSSSSFSSVPLTRLSTDATAAGPPAADIPCEKLRSARSTARAR